jgi:drug/metabolite transporter (DMT)-like permease
MTRRGWLLFATMGLIWGIPYLMIKVAVGGLHPATLVFLRTALAALLLVPIAAVRGELRPLLRYWRPLLAFAAIEVAVPWLLLNTAEVRLSSSLSGLLIAGVPLVGAILGWATGGERLGPVRIAGLIVGLDLHVGDVWALLEIAGVAVGYAVGPWILARYLSGLPGLGVIAAALGVTALAYLPFALTQLPARVPSRQVLGSVLVLAVVCTALAFVLFFALIAEVGPVRATVITYINPAVAVSLGVLLLHEPFTVGIGVGFALVLTGSVLATRKSRDRSAPEPAPVAAPS